MTNTRLILIRHGETESNRDQRFLGWGESPLTQLGQQQTTAVAEALRDVPLVAIYSSPNERTLAMAHAIVDVHHGLGSRSDLRLREINSGQLEGLTVSQIRERWPGLLDQIRSNPCDTVWAGGESIGDLQTRVWSAIEEILVAHPDGSVAVISHALAVRVVVCKVLDVPLSALWRMSLSNGGLVRLGYFWGDSFGVLSFNETQHLQA